MALPQTGVEVDEDGTTAPSGLLKTGAAKSGKKVTFDVDRQETD